MNVSDNVHNGEDHVIDAIEAYLAGGLSPAERARFEMHVAACATCAALLDEAARSDAAVRELFADQRPGEDFEDRLVGTLRRTPARASILPRGLPHPMVRRIASGVAATVVLGAVGFVASGPLQGRPLALTTRKNPDVARASTVSAFASERVSAQGDREAAEALPALPTPAEVGSEKTKELKSGLTDLSGVTAGDEARPEILHYWEKQSGKSGFRTANPSPAPAPPPAPDESARKYLGVTTWQLDSATPNFSDAPDFSLEKNRQQGGGGGGGSGGSGGPGVSKSGAMPGQPAGEGQGQAAQAPPALRGIVIDPGKYAYGRGGFGDGVSTGAAPSKPGDQSAPGAAAGFGLGFPVDGKAAGKGEGEKSFRPNDMFGVAVGTESAQTGVQTAPQGTPAGGKDTGAEAFAPPPKGNATIEDVTADASPPKPDAPAPNPEAPAPAPAAPPAPVDPPRPAAMQRKIIRNGQMTFEVDSFDSSLTQITKIAQEESGFIATTDSEKLPNGRVKGSVIVRCPPERLDTLVLKLRGLGELKTQKIAAQDVTKQYTDLESQLKAARTMEERILQIIKSGKGEIKDLIEAEKQLGVWREKIEGLEGEIRYLSNLVSLSTLSVTLLERDVKGPTSAFEQEKVQMGVETDDVEKARSEALKAIETAKGRVIESDVKQHEAGQYTATIRAEVPPDASGPMIDRLKQVGKVSRFDVTRRTTTQGGTGAPAASLRVERRDTEFLVNVYNLARIAPRQTTTMDAAAADVEKAYRAILDQVSAGGGRVVESTLNRGKGDGAAGTTGNIQFQVPSDKADVVLAAIRSAVEVMRLDVTQNPDTQNVTEAKRGFSVRLIPLAAVAPREATALQLYTASVPESFRKLLEAARATGGRVITSQLNEQDPNNISATLEFDVQRDQWPSVEPVLREAGLIATRTVTRSQDTDNTVDSKIRLNVTLFDEVRLTPRETVSVTVASVAVPDTFNALLTAVREAGGRVVSSQLTAQDKADASGEVRFTVSKDNRGRIESMLTGGVVRRAVAYAADGPTTVDAKVGLVVSVVAERTLRPREVVSLRVVGQNVAERYQEVLDKLREVDAQVLQSKLNDPTQGAGPAASGVLEFVIRRDKRAEVEKVLSRAADVFDRNVTRAAEAANVVDYKVGLQVTLEDAERQPPRQNYVLAVEVGDVMKSMGDIEAAAVAAGGRKVDSTHSRDRDKDVARVVVDVPMSRAGDVVNAVRGQGKVTMAQSTRNENVPEGTLSRARVEVTLGSPGIIDTRSGFWDTIRSGLSTSVEGLLWSLQFVIVGLFLVAPWALVLWLAWRVIRRARRRDGAVRTPATPGNPLSPPPSPA